MPSSPCPHKTHDHDGDRHHKWRFDPARVTVVSAMAVVEVEADVTVGRRAMPRVAAEEEEDRSRSDRRWARRANGAQLLRSLPCPRQDDAPKRVGSASCSLFDEVTSGRSDAERPRACRQSNVTHRTTIETWLGSSDQSSQPLTSVMERLA